MSDNRTRIPVFTDEMLRSAIELLEETKAEIPKYRVNYNPFTGKYYEVDYVSQVELISMDNE